MVLAFVSLADKNADSPILVAEANVRFGPDGCYARCPNYDVGLLPPSTFLPSETAIIL